MKFDKKQLLLYGITDRRWLRGDTLAHQVELACQGGVTCIQLREKELDTQAFIEEATIIKAITGRYNVPLIINDNIDVALAVDADGVHVGQKDLEAGRARALLGPDKILGVSAKTIEAAAKAKANGADYIGIGAVFSTSTKGDATTISFDTLKEVCQTVDIPAVAIGGITAENALQLKGSCIDGLAVVSALFAADDIKSATSQMLTIATTIVNG